MPESRRDWLCTHSFTNEPYLVVTGPHMNICHTRGRTWLSHAPHTDGWILCHELSPRTIVVTCPGRTACPTDPERSRTLSRAISLRYNGATPHNRKPQIWNPRSPEASIDNCSITNTWCITDLTTAGIEVVPHYNQSLVNEQLARYAVAATTTLLLLAAAVLCGWVRKNACSNKPPPAKEYYELQQSCGCMSAAVRPTLLVGWCMRWFAMVFLSVCCWQAMYETVCGFPCESLQ